MDDETPEQIARREAARAERRRIALERDRLALSREQAEETARERAESARERQEELERRREQEEARQEQRQRNSIGGRIQGARDSTNERIQGATDAFQNRAMEITINTAKSKKFWLIFLLGLILFFTAYYEFPSFRTFLFGIGISIAGLIAIVVIFLFIGWGLWKGVNGDIAALFIALALLVWMVDLAPEWIIPWPPYAGFELPLSLGVWSLSLLPVMTSSFTFAFLYINMVLKIIKKEYIYFSLAFLLILLINYIFPKILPNSFLNFNFSIPGFPLIFIIVVLITVGIIWYFHKKSASAEISDFLSSLWMIFVFSFFWVNNGWQNNLRAWIHVLYIIFFGFVYIKSREKDRVVYNILFPSLLFIDFFGYGFLWNSNVIALRTLPPLVILVISYCYVKESNEVDGKKKATYPVLAFILLVTFFLIMTVKVAGLQENSLPFIAKQGATYKDFYSQFTDNLRQLIEGRLDIATAGLYRGNVENNRYESLGVYFTNIRAADPRFYTDEPITVWSSIRSKTYKDPVIINFSCYRWKDNNRIYADRTVPEIRFPIFQLEEIDTECTFLPSKEDDKSKKYTAGGNTVTLSAQYNFATDSYLKAYFIDRDRFKSYSREAIDPLTELGIKDKTPASVSTNGPVELGIGAGPLVPVSQDYAVKPVVGITLTNRKGISDKDKRIIQKWDGKIKNITELVLLTPPGITLGTQEELDTCRLPTNNPERLKCPCNFPFKPYKREDCQNSCFANVRIPCKDACDEVYKKDSTSNGKDSCINDCASVFTNCNNECATFFNLDKDEGTGKYNGYQLDVGSVELKDLNKDIDKHRTFVCRYTPTPAVLENTPITTRYFRVRARYNYAAENSVIVNVENPPITTINVVPDSILKISSDVRFGSDLWFDGLTNELVSAIASVESKGFKHCCQETQSKGTACTSSSDKSCDFDKLVVSYDKDGKKSSYGIMQINYQGKNKDWADSLAKNKQNGCGKDSSGNDILINNYDCNVKVGIVILKSKYDTFKNGCSGFPKIKNACDNCKSTRTPFKKYSDYRDVEAALRGYNGWGCDPKNSDTGYVEKVLEAMKTISGVKIVDPTTLGGIKREGEGMMDASSTQSEEESSVSGTTTPSSPTGSTPSPDPALNIKGTYNFVNGVTKITWDKSFTAEVTRYKVTRSSSDGESGIFICEKTSDGRNQYSCDDTLTKKFGTKYTYTIATYAKYGSNEGFSEATTEVQL